jgi:hypothetical protein
MNNQKIILGLMMGVLMLIGFGLNRAFAEAGISGNAPAGQSDLSPQDKTSDSKPTDSGPPITQAQIDHPKTIKIPGQNKCQTLDGFSASEPCPSGGSHHHSKHSTHNSGTTDTSSTTFPPLVALAAAANLFSCQLTDQTLVTVMMSIQSHWCSFMAGIVL